jgi:hypothetical protein
MGCRGALFAITQKEAERLRAARGNDTDVLSIVQDEIEEAWEELHLCETDKAWDAMHRCLTNGKLSFDESDYPRNLCILGGEQLHAAADYIVSLLTPEQVTEVAVALQPIERDWFHDQYFKIDREEYGFTFGEEDFEYTWDYFERVRKFYVRAASEDRWTIFTVDQ